MSVIPIDEAALLAARTAPPARPVVEASGEREAMREAITRAIPGGLGRGEAAFEKGWKARATWASTRVPDEQAHMEAAWIRGFECRARLSARVPDELGLKRSCEVCGAHWNVDTYECPVCQVEAEDAASTRVPEAADGDREAIIAALRILQDRSIGSPEANERTIDVLVAALGNRVSDAASRVPDEAAWARGGRQAMLRAFAEWDGEPFTGTGRIGERYWERAWRDCCAWASRVPSAPRDLVENAERRIRDIMGIATGEWGVTEDDQRVIDDLFSRLLAAPSSSVPEQALHVGKIDRDEFDAALADPAVKALHADAAKAFGAPEQVERGVIDRALECAEASLHRERQGFRSRRQFDLIEAELAQCVRARAVLDAVSGPPEVRKAPNPLNSPAADVLRERIGRERRGERPPG